MFEERTEDYEPVVKRADALEVGDHVVEAPEYGKGNQPMRVLLAHPFTNGDGRRFVALELDALDGREPMSVRANAEAKYEMADEQDLAAFHDGSRRRALADALHQLATDIVEQRLPITTSWFSFGPGVLDSRADLEQWAQYFDAEVKMGGSAGDIPVARAERPVGERLRLDFHAQCSPEPVVEFARPVGFASAIDQAERDALTASPEHYHAAGAGGEVGACSAVCACGVTFAGFDSIAEAVVELDKHIANPEPVEPEQEWLFTFGSGQQHDGRFVRITGTEVSARKEMNRIFGHAWCDQYSWQSFDAAGLPARLTELERRDWPAHAAAEPTDDEIDRAFAEPQDGHVYSCCGKTGRISRHESWCETNRPEAADVPSQRAGE